MKGPRSLEGGWGLLSMVAFVASLGGCSTPNANDRVIPLEPDRTTFPAVSDLLDHRCGTLDCHGNTFRNLRVYGREGLRLASTDQPVSHGSTTAAEYDQTFSSIIFLEPELMSEVVGSGGANPERLTFVRKARGTEHHKGGTVFREGEQEDRCVTSWLSGHTDVALCQTALATTF